MLVQVSGARLLHDAGALTGRGWLVFVLSGRALLVGSKKIAKREYDELIQQQLGSPTYVVTVNGWNFWMFGGRFYSATEWLEPDAVYAELVSGHVREERQSA